MHPPPFTDGSTDALIASRLPSWLIGASLDTLYSLHASQQWQQHVQHQLHERLASILPLDAFAAPLLQQALYTRHGLTLDVRKAMLRRRTLQRFPSHIATLPDGVKEHVHQQSLLAAALHNFTEGETFASAILQGTVVQDSNGQDASLSPKAFYTLCRNLDLGGQYQAYLDTRLRPGGEPGRQLEALLQEGYRAGLEAALRLSLYNGEISRHGFDQCLPLASLVAGKPSAGTGLQPHALRVFGKLARGVAVFAVAASDRSQKGLLCWVPDDPQGALTWYSTWDQLFLTMGKQFRLPGYVDFFQRFISERDREAYSRALGEALKQGDENVPVRLDGRHEVIEQPLFEYLCKQQIDTLLDNARVLAVPTADVDAQVRDRRLHFYLESALDLLGLASFGLPALALPLLGITALQVAGEVYEGYADWRLGDRQAALEHLYSVAETVIMTGANVGAGLAAQRLARAVQVDELVPVQYDEHRLKLCDPVLPGYAIEPPGSTGALPLGGPGERVRTPVGSFETYLEAQSQQRRIRHPQRTNAYAPMLESNGAGGWRHELESPHEWQGRVHLLQDLASDLSHLDAEAANDVLLATGLNEDHLRRLHLDHAPPPARLLDAAERHRMHTQVPWLRGDGFEEHLQAQQGVATPEQAVLRRDFPGLSIRGAREIVEHASEDQVEQLLIHQRVPLALAEQARWQLHDARLDRACAGLRQAAAINRDTEQLALSLVGDEAPWRGTRVEVRLASAEGERMASVGVETSGEIRTLVRTADGYNVIARTGDPLSPPSSPCSLFEALIQLLDPWQRKQLGEAADSPQALADALSLRASQRRERVADVLGMAPVVPGFRPPVRLGDGRVGYPLSGRGESSLRALRRGMQRLFPDLDDHAFDDLIDRARSLGLTAWNYHLRLSGQLRALDLALSRWRRQSSGPVQLLRRARMARRIRNAWRRSIRDEAGNFALILENSRLGSLPDLPDTVSFDHVTTLTLTNLELAHVDARFLSRFPSVTRLDLTGNRLTELPTLEHTPWLETLRLAHNRIVITEPGNRQLAGLNHLTTLDLDFNALEVEPRVNLSTALRRLHLRGNRLRTVPLHLLQQVALEQIDLRGNRIGTIDEAQLALLNAYPDRVRLQDNPLPPVILERLDERVWLPPLQPLPAQPAPHESDPWLAGLSGQEAARRREAWQALRAERGSEDFFAYLEAVRGGEQFTRQPAEARRRVGELLETMWHNSVVRSAVFRQAAMPRGRADLDVLVVRLQVELRTQGLRGRREERALRDLARELFRLEQVNRFAAQHIERLRLPSGEARTNDVYLAFRVGLADALGIYGQPTYLNLQHVTSVTPELLSEAEAAVHEAETAEALSQFLSRQSFWQDYVRVAYADEFAEIRHEYAPQLGALEPEPGAAHAPMDAVNRIVAQRQASERALTLKLARGNAWAWFRFAPPHGPGLRAFTRLSRQLEQSLDAWRGLPTDEEYHARSTVAQTLRQAWYSGFRDEGTGSTPAIDGLSVSTLPELPAGIRFDRLHTLSLRNQQVTAIAGDFLRRFPNLEVLNLSGSRISRLEGLEHLPQLRSLNLGGNLLETVTGLENLGQLVELDLSGCRLEALPAGIERLTNLTSLDLAFNQLSELPEQLGALPALENLQLSGNLLTGLPRTIGNLARLNILNLGGNRLSVVPENLNGLARLTQLYLHDNTIVLDAVSESRLEWFSRLEVLSLEGNPLGSAPRLRYNVQLRYLSLRATGLRAFPLRLMQAHPDLSVDLRGNRITALDEEALHWVEANPHTVNLEDNHLSEQVMARVRDALARLQLQWAREEEEGEVTAIRKPPTRRG